MENHPIPQDVTGFQFKLIGSMTIKQFGYVACGVILAVVVYYLPIHFIFKMIFIPIFGGSGFAVAFLPIEGRPIDVMAANFFKAIASPNQYIYNKAGRQFSFANISSSKLTPQQVQKTTPDVQSKEQQLRNVLKKTTHVSKNQLDEKEASFLKVVGEPAVVPVTLSAQPAAAPPPPQNTIQLSAVSTQAQNLTQQETQLTQALAVAKQQEAGKPQIEILERQVQALHFQRQQLEQQLQQLQAQMTTAAAQPQLQPQRVHNIPKEMVKSAGLPHISDTPNVIVGIVKDSRGNVLSGMLVEVKDKDNNPVRAFKTNQLGQFASATPLSPGTYTIELEDPKKQHTFDIIQIVADNQILLPIEIISHDEREELRKQLFN